MPTCSRCGRRLSMPHLECPRCEEIFCWDCAAESAQRCLKCGGPLSPFRPPLLEPSMEWVPS